MTGLVPCPITRAGKITTVPDDLSGLDARSVWAPRFPRAEGVSAAAAELPAIGDGVGALREGPRFEVWVAPGMVRVGARDWARADRTAARVAEDGHRAVDLEVSVASVRRAVAVAVDGGLVDDEDEAVAAFLAADDQDEGPRRSVIYEWSRKSRARMVKTACELDYAPLYEDPSRLPAMLTLTYPGDWLTVAPNGRAVKHHLDKFRKRWISQWGEAPRGLWKLEFQARGAPHIHMFTTIPAGRGADGSAFRAWLSEAWADVVAHPDPVERMRHERAGTGVDLAEGLRARDAKAVAVYFTKHGMLSGKEYQNSVPREWREALETDPTAGPGRFWGYWGLRKAVSGVQVTAEDAIVVGRTLRRLSRAQGRVQSRERMRVEQSTGRVYFRRSRSRVVLLARGRGWVSVNNGPALAHDLARYLATRGASPPGEDGLSGYGRWRRTVASRVVD